MLILQTLPGDPIHLACDPWPGPGEFIKVDRRLNCPLSQRSRPPQLSNYCIFDNTSPKPFILAQYFEFVPNSLICWFKAQCCDLSGRKPIPLIYWIYPLA
jgi:hypothetical protein